MLSPPILYTECTLASVYYTIFVLFSFILLSMSCFVAVTPVVRPDIYRGGARLHRFGKGGNNAREKTYLEWKDTDTLKMFSSASMSKKAFFFHIPYTCEAHYIICLRLNIRCFFIAAFRERAAVSNTNRQLQTRFRDLKESLPSLYS